MTSVVLHRHSIARLSQKAARRKESQSCGRFYQRFEGLPLVVLLSRTPEPLQRERGVNLLKKAFEQTADAQIVDTEIRSACLQPVDDLKARYRAKGTGHYKGYVAKHR